MFRKCAFFLVFVWWQKSNLVTQQEVLVFKQSVTKTRNVAFALSRLQSTSAMNEQPHVWVLSKLRAQNVDTYSLVFQQKVHVTQQVQKQVFHEIQTDKPVLSWSCPIQCVQPNWSKNVQRLRPVFQNIIHQIHGFNSAEIQVKGLIIVFLNHVALTAYRKCRPLSLADSPSPKGLKCSTENIWQHWQVLSAAICQPTSSP